MATSKNDTEFNEDNVTHIFQSFHFVRRYKSWLLSQHLRMRLVQGFSQKLEDVLN